LNKPTVGDLDSVMLPASFLPEHPTVGGLITR
jgi:hypothetical protein